MALVNPLGKDKKLNPRLLEGDALKEAKEKAKSLTEVKTASRETGDLIMLGIGGFTPLD
jgi:sulfate adenylyltransferase